MKNTFGTCLSITLFGESHQEAVGCVMDGLPAGIKLDVSFIHEQLKRRRPQGEISTKRVEQDVFKIVSGFFNGYTTGSPMTILIENSDVKSEDYQSNIVRPSHVDYVAECKYQGYQDYRGSGHFSGRLTAPLVIAGAVCLQLLKSIDVEIASHILKIKDIQDDGFQFEHLAQQIKVCNTSFNVLNKDIKEAMVQEITKAKEQCDSVGGVIESIIVGLKPGVGEPFFDSIESVISHLLFSIPAVKGVQFGLGFSFSDYYGSQVRDEYQYIDHKVVTTSNYNGGIHGGLSNGMPITIQSVIKPTSSIERPFSSIDLTTKENIKTSIQGRHDPCIVHRAVVVVDSMLAIAVVDLLLQEYGRELFRVVK